jgi:hypothetical protein
MKSKKKIQRFAHTVVENYSLILASPIISYFLTIFLVATFGEFVSDDRYMLHELIVIQVALLFLIFLYLFKKTS